MFAIHNLQRHKDPHFWMPLTLPQDEYISLMSQKGVDTDESRTHHVRMTKMKDAFVAANSDLGLFGAVDVGSNACEEELQWQ